MNCCINEHAEGFDLPMCCSYASATFCTWFWLWEVIHTREKNLERKRGLTQPFSLPGGLIVHDLQVVR